MSWEEELAEGLSFSFGEESLLFLAVVGRLIGGDKGGR
jgi:hypothetical protein